MRNTTVLISGASIAGPALAHWLHRYGFWVTVVERAPQPRPGGQTVDLRGVGKDAAQRMGLMPEIRRHLVHERGMAYVDARGRHVAEMPAELFGGEGPVAEIEILRSDLTRILYDATRLDVEYLFDDTITALAQGGDGVKVEFENRSARSFDLVIGADGTHSCVRSLAFDAEPAAVRHLGSYVSYFTAPQVADLGGWFEMYNAPGGVMAAMRPDRGPGFTRVLLGLASPLLESVRPGYDRRDVEAQKRLVADRFAGAGWHVPALVEAMWQAPDFYFDGTSQVHLEKWSRGRVTLLGDAGYCASPLSGQGTSLALVGACVLAGELVAADGDHEVAFPRYQAALSSYVQKCQQLPPGSSWAAYPASRAGIWLRNRSMRAMTGWPFRRLLEKAVRTDDPITLQAYGA